MHRGFGGGDGIGGQAGEQQQVQRAILEIRRRTAGPAAATRPAGPSTHTTPGAMRASMAGSGPAPKANKVPAMTKKSRAAALSAPWRRESRQFPADQGDHRLSTWASGSSIGVWVLAMIMPPRCALGAHKAPGSASMEAASSPVVGSSSSQSGLLRRRDAGDGKSPLLPGREKTRWQMCEFLQPHRGQGGSGHLLGRGQGGLHRILMAQPADPRGMGSAVRQGRQIVPKQRRRRRAASAPPGRAAGWICRRHSRRAAAGCRQGVAKN